MQNRRMKVLRKKQEQQQQQQQQRKKWTPNNQLTKGISIGHNKRPMFLAGTAN